MIESVHTEASSLLGAVGQDLLDAIPAAIVYLDRHLTIRLCNATFLEWFGGTHEDYVGRQTPREVAGEEAFAKILPYLERALGGEACGYEQPLQLEHGPSGIIRARYTPHRDEDGEVAGLFAFIENVTRQREMERQLKNRKQNLELAMDAGRFGSWVASIETRVAELDTTLARIIQLPSEVHHLKLDDFVQLVADEDRDRVAAAVERTLTEEVDFSEQYRQVLPDGSYVWLSTYGKIHRDDHGNADRVVGVTHDITPQKEAEERLRKLNQNLQHRADRSAVALQMSEANLRAIVATAADAIFTVDEQRAVLSANPSAAAMFGTGNDPGALIGKSIDELIGTSKAPLDPAAESGSGDGQAATHNTLAYRLDGSSFLAEFSVAHAEGQPFSVLLLRDISERREFESAVLRATEDEKERIARDLHDGLGSLLGGVTCLAKALENELGGSDQPGGAKARQIGKAAQESVTLTRRLAHGLYAVGSDPGALVEALCEFARMTESSHPVRCLVDCPERLEVGDRVVANHLFRIAQEAVTNAVRHSSADTVRILLAEHHGELRLRIEDNGEGLQRPGQQGGSNDRGGPAPSGGIDGLGLRTMQYRAHELRGELEIQSDTNGTSVTCVVPL